MAEFNLTYYKEKDRYSDGAIEEVMLDMAERGVSYEELPHEEVSFPVIYHFSAMRENILNWYPFKKDAAVLEIGAGCGAITGLLCRRAAKVVSVELSKRRASINYARHKEYDNLCIMVGNLNDMEFPEKFDYIILNGVLEYAISFTEGETPYETFLQHMGCFLKEEGRILIAIENRLGLKYFAGAPEDHTDRYFLGLENYPGVDTVRTFSKKELRELLERSGFPGMQFYYPYPDYKFPREIFTDETLKANGYGKPYRSLDGKRILLFNESEAAHSLAEEGVADIFSNSFLVDAGRTPQKQPEEILYVKSNSERRREFQILTKIIRRDGERLVRKEPLCAEAEPFVRQIIANGAVRYGTDYENLPAAEKDGALEYAFVEGETLFDRIRTLADAGDTEGIVQLLQKFYETCFAGCPRKEDYAGEAFQKLFGSAKGQGSRACVRPANLDLICDNVYMEKQRRLVIDYEWIFDMEIPVDFIMWRLLNDLYTKLPQLRGLFVKKTLMDIFGITGDDEELYRKWSQHFVYRYVGADPLDKYAQPEINFRLEQVYQYYHKAVQTECKLYYDTGGGFNEEEILPQPLTLTNNRFRISFDLSDIKGIKKLRWDPMEESCWCMIDRVKCNCGVRLQPLGDFRREGNCIIFTQDDPNFAVETFDADEIRTLTIEGRCARLAEQQGTESMRMSREDIEALRVGRQSIESVRAGKSVQAVSARVDKSVQAASSRLKKMLSEKRRPAREGAVLQAPKLQPDTVKNQLRKVKRAAKKIPGLVKVSGHVDTFTVDRQVLSMSGWVFDNRCRMRNPRIVYYDRQTKVAERPFRMVYRYDVASALQNPDAALSGFEVKTRIFSPRDIRVVMEYDMPDGTGRYPLGVVKGSRSLPADAKVEISEIMEAEQLGDIQYLREKKLTETFTIPKKVKETAVDIIIPVYNGYEYLQVLFDSLRRTEMPYRLLIVNDCSPDERVLPYLENYVKNHPEAVLLNNEKNVGFVRSVNRALKRAEHHVVLLNTDVEVPAYWLERLMLPIICDKKVATTTPFTNSGTICSFPKFCENNELFEGMPLWQIDQAFSQIVPSYPVVPTGVGFCMGMNLNVIKKIGLLDAKTFGKGYGEENDWCRRAVSAGYHNVQADNLFVYHKHGGSFLSEEKKALLETNSKALRLKHPDYDQVVSSYCSRDPMAKTRRLAMLKLLNLNIDAKTIVAFDHNLGGGATAYLDTKRREALRVGCRFIVVRFTGMYLVEYSYRQYRIQVVSENLEDVWAVTGRVDEIWINELVTVPKLYDVMDALVRAKEQNGARMLMLFHDYYAICPAINLVDDRGCYCGAAAPERCNACLAKHEQNAYLAYESAEKWRESWERFLAACGEVRVFSDASRKLLEKVYPALDNIRLVPHKPHTMLPLHKTGKTGKTLNIGFVGALDYKKGLQVVQQLAAEIKKQKCDIRLCLLGYTGDEGKNKIFKETGKYRREELPRLVLENDIDLFFIPAVWPETFSYTTAEIMAMNMPLAVFDIGAPAERVKDYARGAVLPLEASPAEILEQLQAFAERCGIMEQPVRRKKVLFLTGPEADGAGRRAAQFREQLAIAGYASGHLEWERDLQVNLKGYCSVVLCRLTDAAFVEALVRQAHGLSIPVYYDLDELIFDGDRLPGQKTPGGSAYQSRKKTAQRIHRCMAYCDGFIAATESLAEEIRTEFPEKTVVVRRNVCSMEQQILSIDARENRAKSGDALCIGYFGGRDTGDAEFAVVEELLTEIMQKYPQVHLVVSGVADTARFDNCQERMTKLPPAGWQRMPELLAGIDILLMPLPDERFYACRPQERWMEAALVEVPCIASANEETRRVIRDGEDGILCADEQQWREGLTRLIEDGQLRGKIAENAHRAVLEHGTTDGTGRAALKLVLGKMEH
ncbi:glycosyltransferase, group 2 family protein [Marvinbryantia formatexigens DSM 14469]|uniref:Glycosyltransferase, group 2 family protein n=1 Tax=Marvinbryantia formatexigens DSM 14469 TaxID=478749 RepID=C6LFR9_9FIRM|nr:glycosyltransferase [Marvinbryantia formatexigens]EET60654.1 glycosyltransferase, group 2 family protein [Marvinbryantia formatexigens DSM 14469]UWO25637.1 glycosyltransferase [Marvinbryantia formatexigens DSM 14469]SDG16363.1 Glycosyltransferase, GT2 family [Marvinbryantia formatexigens]